MSHVTVVIPTIAPRKQLLQEALDSVDVQSFKDYEILVAEDLDHAGAAVTRHEALMKVKSPWVAFLDDDDMFMAHHLDKLIGHQEETNADYVYSWFWTLPAGLDPFPPGHFLDPWDKDNPRQTTITTLVRTELAQQVGFLGPDPDPTGDGMRSGEDWGFTLECNRLGTISHLVERTWYWRHWGGNTSGLGNRW